MAHRTLTQYQQQLCQATLAPETQGIPPGLAKALTPGGELSPLGALNVYRTGYIVRLTEALGETFEAVWWVMGDDNFFHLIKRFILANPSRVPNLSHYGQEFPEFLVRVAPFPDLPFLGDLARFEWDFQKAFHSSPHSAVSKEMVEESIPHPNIRFEFGPSVHLFESPYSIYSLWDRRGGEHDGSLPIDWQIPQQLLLYKKKQQVFVHMLDEPEFTILALLQKGDTLEDSLNQASTRFSNLNQSRVSNLFQLIFHAGIITGLNSEPIVPR